MAKEKASDRIEARVLCDYWNGECVVKADSVVVLTPAQLAAYKGAGYVDDHPDAVAYVKSLKKD